MCTNSVELKAAKDPQTPALESKKCRSTCCASDQQHPGSPLAERSDHCSYCEPVSDIEECPESPQTGRGELDDPLKPELNQFLETTPSPTSAVKTLPQLNDRRRLNQSTMGTVRSPVEEQIRDKRSDRHNMACQRNRQRRSVLVASKLCLKGPLVSTSFGDCLRADLVA